jgi:alpha/beta superfamily hydrolase
MSENILEIQGDAGIIEARYCSFDRATSAALICHPHPLYGGSMYDAVVSCLCSAAHNLKISSLCFNFRGVGRSEGSHDSGIGEVDDVVFLAHWLKEQGGIESIFLGGYSFGATIAFLAASKLDRSLEHLMLVAPPMQESSKGLAVPCPTTIVAGERDSFVDIGALQHWSSAGNSPVELIQIEAADHFFLGFHHEIESVYMERLAKV